MAKSIIYRLSRKNSHDLSRPCFFLIEMEEIDSEKTISDDEFDPNQFEHMHDDDGDDDDGWEINLDDEVNLINLNEEINPSESASQVSGASTSRASSNNTSSAVWLYFDKNLAHTPGYNVCKVCSKKYQLSTSVTSLRKHLKIHQLRAPTRTQKDEQKKIVLLTKMNKQNMIYTLFDG